MTEYLTEQEQIELLKGWIKQYSLVILAGVLIAVIGMSGWRYYQQQRMRTLTQASTIYDDMLTKRAQNEPDDVTLQSQKLTGEYAKTIYGKIASLMLGRSAAVKGNYPAAADELRNVIEKTNDIAIRQIARLRLARILLVEKKPDESIKLLETVDDTSFAGLINEVRGDAYLVMRQNEKAREAYQQAIHDLPNAEVARPLLQMKYDNLAATTSSTP